MERLTVPDTYIDGGKSRAIIDAREVKEEAMTIYWALKKYEDTGLTPEEIMDGKMLTGWIPVEECLPQPHTDVIVTVQEFGEDTFRMIDCLVEGDGGKLMWSTYNGALERVLAWMPLPEGYEGNNK